MFKRTIWFAVGAASGAGASVYSYVRLREVRGKLAPDRVADTLVDTARSLGEGARTATSAIGKSVRSAMWEGRAAMIDAELRIEAELDSRPSGMRRLGGGEVAGDVVPLRRDRPSASPMRRAQ
ncbi:MAG: hypothetical protein WCK41_01050 [Actinomycetes bacterium]